MFDKPSFQVPLQHFGTQGKEVEAVRVFQNLLGEFRFLGG
jgi:hypothetical protein